MRVSLFIQYQLMDGPAKSASEFARFKWPKRRLPNHKSKIIRRDLRGVSWICNSFAYRYYNEKPPHCIHPSINLFNKGNTND